MAWLLPSRLLVALISTLSGQSWLYNATVTETIRASQNVLFYPGAGKKNAKLTWIVLGVPESMEETRIYQKDTETMLKGFLIAKPGMG